MIVQQIKAKHRIKKYLFDWPKDTNNSTKQTNEGLEVQIQNKKSSDEEDKGNGKESQSANEEENDVDSSTTTERTPTSALVTPKLLTQ